METIGHGAVRPSHLQMLKFSYKQDRLNFTDDLVADEVDYDISGCASKKAIDELVAAT